MDFYFVMYYIFVHTDPYEHVGKIQKKRKENLTYIDRRLTRLHTDKKEGKKHTPEHSSLFTWKISKN